MINVFFGERVISLKKAFVKPPDLMIIKLVMSKSVKKNSSVATSPRFYFKNDLITFYTNKQQWCRFLSQRLSKHWLCE